MATVSRYGDDPVLSRAARRAALHVIFALCLTGLFVVLSVAVVGAKFGLWAVFHGAGSVLTMAATELHWWGVLAVLLGVVALSTMRLLRAAVPRQLPPDAVLLPDDHPATQSLARLAVLADLPAPELRVVPSTALNAFVAHDEDEPVAVVVTQGALDSCPPVELEAMLAHELFHVAHADTRLTRRLEKLGEVAQHKAPQAVADYVLGSVRAMMRQRELSADRAAALLTGRPSAMLDAVQRCSDAREVAPVRDLREALTVGFVSASIAPRRPDHATHPSAVERADVLARVARSLGSA